MIIKDEVLDLYYIGQNTFGNYNINFPNRFYIKNSNTFETFSSDLSSIFESLEYKNYFVENQEAVNNEFFIYNSAASTHLFSFTFKDDLETSSHRIRLTSQKHSTQNTNFIKLTIFDNNSDSTILIEKIITSNVFFLSKQNNYSPIFYTVTAGIDFFGIIFYTQNMDNGNIVSVFLYASKLNNVNPNHNYYDSNYKNTLIILSGQNGNPVEAQFNINGFNRIGHQGEKADFHIVCEDGRKPTQNWSTDCLIFDNMPALNHPLIGIAPGLALGIGKYSAFKPVEMNGIEDGGSNKYIPVGIYANKMLMMRSN